MIKITAQRKDRILIGISPIFLGVLALGLIRINSAKWKLSPQIGWEVTDLLVSLWGTLLGFIITAISILIVMNEENSLVKKLKEAEHFNTILYSALFTSIYLLFGIIIAVIIRYLGLWSDFIYGLMAACIVTIFFSLFFFIMFLFTIVCKK